MKDFTKNGARAPTRASTHTHARTHLTAMFGLDQNYQQKYEIKKLIFY